jgi:hypothetical protein
MKRVLRHVVMFQFKQGIGEPKIREIEAAFASLPGKIEVIRDFEWGRDVSVEGKAGGFSHCFLVTFASEADRDTYLPHPAHQEFVALVRPNVEKSLVLDYWAG